MKKPILLTLCLLTGLSGCGPDKESIDEVEEGNEEQERNQETQGTYESFLVPVNTEVNGSTVGFFRIRILGEEMKVRGEVENSPPVFHRQFIHTGPNCPGLGADTDLDGVISFGESMRITGPALIPLDQNLSSQTAGFIFPVPGAMGAYTYMETTSISGMSADLRADDPDPLDYLVKLSSDENLNLAGRTIVIYGIAGDHTLPIACGSIQRSNGG